MNNLTIKEARRKLDAKEITSIDLTKFYLENIGEHNETLNAFITISRDEALAMAAAADERIKNGESTPLLGIPLALKDIFSTKDIRTTAASKVLEDYIPQYDGTVVTKLKEAGAVILGKTNLGPKVFGKFNTKYTKLIFINFYIYNNLDHVLFLVY
jgi:aspartyl-tRNA(Asn)/glutamyl-tRNA(Gln) amidotransferase subunit A